MTAVQDPTVSTVPHAETGSRRLLACAGVALVVSAVAQWADELFAGPAQEISDTWWFRASTGVSLVAFALLAVSVAVVQRRRWAGNGRGGRVLDALLWAGCLQAVCAMWADAFVTPVLADAAPDLVYAEPGAMGVGLNVALLTFTVAFLALGVAALRARRVSRVTAGLLLATGLTMVIVPGAQLLAGLALLVGRAEGERLEPASPFDS
jgi:hypothetical protein